MVSDAAINSSRSSSVTLRLVKNAVKFNARVSHAQALMKTLLHVFRGKVYTQHPRLL